MTVEECYKLAGADYDDVIGRLRTDERILKFLIKFTEDTSFGILEKALGRRDLEEAFRAAHTLKGVCGNLALERLFISTSHLTEALRGRRDYGADLDRLFERVKKDYQHTIECVRGLNA